MPSTIRRPNPFARLEKELAALRAENERLRADNQHMQSEQLKACRAQEAEDDEPVCDLCALDAERHWLAQDITAIQHLMRNEICGPHYCAKFKCNGLADELTLLGQIASCQLALKEQELAAVNYEYAACCAGDSEAVLADLIEQLTVLVDSNPDIDERCEKFIDKVLNAY